MIYRCPRCHRRKRYRSSLHGREGCCLQCFERDGQIIRLKRVAVVDQ